MNKIDQLKNLKQISLKKTEQIFSLKDFKNIWSAVTNDFQREKKITHMAGHKKLIMCLQMIWFKDSANNSNGNKKGGETLLDLILSYFQLWSLEQWIFSLIGLVLMYWLSGYFYNKWLSKKGGWMDAKKRIYLIVLDLLLNFAFGIYYMSYRETVIGTFIVKCPIAFSPLLWILELICFYIYWRYLHKENWWKLEKKN